MLSCSRKVVSLSKLKSEYEFVDFEGHAYFDRKSDAPMQSKMSIDCIFQKDALLKTWTGEGPEVRDVTKYGLEMKDLIDLKN